MANYIWNVTSGNFGAASSWSPTGTPTSADTTNIGTTTSVFGGGSADNLNIYGNDTVTISATLSAILAGYASIGSNSGLTTVDVDAAWTGTGGVNIGFINNSGGAYDASFYVNAGGSFSAGFIEIGNAYGYTTSSPASSVLGSVIVQGGGKVTSTGLNDYFDEVGSWLGGDGSLTVTGTGSSWTSADGLNIGANGTGTLNVENSATLNTPYLDIGVGYDEPTVASGSGTAVIESGGVVTTTGNYQEIGNGATGTAGDAVEGATGAVTVTGAGSKWIATNGAIEIGDAAAKSGSLTISNGGNVTATNEFDIGNEYNGPDGSYGALLIESGGTAVTGGFINSSGSYDSVGANYSSAPTSTATVTGSGSSWKMNATLAVDESGQVFAQNGGVIDAEQGVILSQGSLLQVDSSSAIEDGNVGGAALGYLTVDPVASNANSNFVGDGTVDANMIDNGKVYVQDGTLTINGPTGAAGAISGSGVLLIGTQADLVLNASDSAVTVKFRGFDGTLTLTEPAAFTAKIQNYDAGDIIDLVNLPYAGTPASYTVAPDGSGGQNVTVTEGSTSVTLDIGSSVDSLTGNLTLSKDASGTGTALFFTNGGSTSPFNLWESLGSFFNTSGGTVNGEDYANSNASDGGNPIWTETETPASSYVAGAAETYTLVLSTQDWLGDIQPEITVATDSNFVDPFTSSSGAPFGNLATSDVFSSTSTQGAGGFVYWAASATAGDYEVEFQPFTVSYPTAAASANLVTLNGSPVTMISAIANPTGWNLSSENSTSFVFAYTTSASSTTENLYFDGFNTSGATTTSGPVLIASNLPIGTPYYIGYNSSGYAFRYLEIGGSLGTGLVGGSFNISTGAVGTASLILSLPNYTAFDGLGSYSISNGNSVRFIEGVENGQDVIQTFLNSTSAPQATFQLSSPTDYFETARVYDGNDGQMDYIALAYVDAGKVHLELLNENGVQIGGDLIIPGLTSFLRIQTLNGGSNAASTRVEIDYEAADPSGGQEIEGLIYDTATIPEVNTLSGGGLYSGTPFSDTFNFAPGVFSINGGGGTDTFSATGLSASQVSIVVNAAGNVVFTYGSGDSDTLLRFTTIALGDATVTIAGNTLTEVFSGGSKTVSTFNITGQPFTSKVISYNASGQIVSKLYEGVTGEGYLNSYEYFYIGGGLVGSSDVFTGLSNPDYTTEQTNYNGAGGLTSEVFSGGGASSPYSQIEYDYVGGVFSGAAFTVTAVPQGASYSSYQIDLNASEAFAGDKFFFTNLSGFGYTNAEEDFDASGDITRAVLTGLTGGQPYYQIEEDYSAGVYEGYKAYYALTGAYSSEEVDVSAANVLEKVVYTGANQTVEEDYSGGSLSGLVYGFSDVSGASYDAYQVYENASGTALSEVFDLDSGVHTQIALVAGQTLTSQGEDKFSGSSSGATTFVLNPIYGQDTITNLTSADSVVMSAAEFSDFNHLFAAAAPSGANVVVTASDGDTLTLKNMTLSTLQGLSSNFTFH